MLNESLGTASASVHTFAKSTGQEHTIDKSEDAYDHSFITHKDNSKDLLSHFKDRGFAIKNLKSYNRAYSHEGETSGKTHRYELHKGGNVFHVNHVISNEHDEWGGDPGEHFHNVSVGREPDTPISKLKGGQTFGQFLSNPPEEHKKTIDKVMNAFKSVKSKQ